MQDREQQHDVERPRTRVVVVRVVDHELARHVGAELVRHVDVSGDAFNPADECGATTHAFHAD
jgi:hypothetical protein